MIDAAKYKEMEAKHPMIKSHVYGVGEGWLSILDELCTDIENSGADIDVLQIKEKFGGLRFYFNGPDTVDGFVRHAEHLSYKTCEVCGNEGHLRGGGWLKTLCDEHADGRPLADDSMF